jgi:hypothetical protein
MTGLGLVRTLSQVGVGLAGRHGGGEESTDGWQDKSAASGSALMVSRTRQFCRLFAHACWRFQSIHQAFQQGHRHRRPDAAENSLEQA